MQFEREKLFIPWNDDHLRINIKHGEDDREKEIFFPHNVDWDYYFQAMYDGNRRIRVDLMLDMNQILAEANILCDRSPGVYGIVNDGMDISRFSKLSNRYYFSRREFAQGYLEAAQKAKIMFEGKAFIFKVV